MQNTTIITFHTRKLNPKYEASYCISVAQFRREHPGISRSFALLSNGGPRSMRAQSFERARMTSPLSSLIKYISLWYIYIYAIDQDQYAIGRGTFVCAALTVLYTTSVTVHMKVGLKNIKQIYHALFQATNEIMDS